MSHVAQHSIDSSRYAKCVEVSKRIRWDIDRDVIRGRRFDFTKKFLPDGLSKVEQLPFLTAAEKRLFSQVQGRTYANIFGLVERYIGAKMLEISRGQGSATRSRSKRWCASPTRSRSIRRCSGAWRR